MLSKKDIRKMISDKRDSLTPDEINSKSYAIYETLTNEQVFLSAGWIMAYIDARNEVRTRAIIQRAWDTSKRVAVPLCERQSHNMIASEITSFDDLCEGSYSIGEPKKECVRYVDARLLDIIIVPAIAYDKRGYRIGYGGGYYDRFLSSLKDHAITIGIAFDMQIVDEIPVEPFDVPVDMVITESGIIVDRR